MSLLISVLEQGFMYGIMALGLYITYKILNFPDLTVDGSFPLGAAVSITLITHGVNPWITLIVALIAGIAAGFITGVMHVKLKIPAMISGIIMMTALYSINYRIAGSANVPVIGHDTIFKSNLINNLPQDIAAYVPMIIVFIVMIIVKIVLDWYLKTKAGMLVLATGDNPQLVTMLGVDPGAKKIAGLAICNGLVSLGGAIVGQSQRYFDVSMGTGTMVMGLAAVVIGITIFGSVKFLRTTTMVLIGAIIYKACVMIAIKLGLAPQDMNLIISILFVVTLVINSKMSKRGEAVA